MKIKAVESILLTVPYEAVGGLGQVAGQSSPGLRMLLVRIETDEGLVGWGEAFGHAVAPGTKAVLDTLVGPALIGRDAADIAGVTDALHRRFHLFGRSGPVVYALSGVDIALWDIAGKTAGLPVHRLLGGARTEELTVYSSFQRCRNPRAVAESCEWALQQGFRHVKLHEVTVEAVRAAREALGEEIELMLDTNCPWSVAEAEEMVRALAPFRLAWLEEPIYPPEDAAGLARLRQAGAIIAAGENASGLHGFHELFRAGALDVAQPSVSKLGGITGMRKALALAEAHGVRVVPHCGYLGPGYLATLHVIAAMPGGELIERLNMQLEASPFGDWTDAPGARARIPQGPGLGCDPEPDLLRRYRVG